LSEIHTIVFRAAGTALEAKTTSTGSGGNRARQTRQQRVVAAGTAAACNATARQGPGSPNQANIVDGWTEKCIRMRIFAAFGLEVDDKRSKARVRQGGREPTCLDNTPPIAPTPVSCLTLLRAPSPGSTA
jgi:hypothetical protein